MVDRADIAWIPELVKVRVRSPSGAAVDLETVRLMRGQKR
jgi:general secretion pathway protein I